MLWGRSKKPDHHYLIVLDIGTTLSKALIVYLQDNEVYVAGRAYAKQAEGAMRGGMIIDLPAVALSCKRAIEEATIGLEVMPNDVILGVNGQLVEGVTTTIHYDRAHPDHPLEHSELKNIIYEIQRRSEEKLKSSLRDKFAGQHPDVELIHAAVVESQLDGYVVETPIGFQGKRLSLTVFNAYLPLVYSSILQNLVKALELNLISIATQPYGLSKLLVNSPTDTDIDGIFIDIGGRCTDIVVVKNGSVEAMQSFAVGGVAATRAIKQAMKLTPERAEKLKKDYCASATDKRTASKVEAALAETVNIWATGIATALQEFPKTKMLPDRLYLTGGGAYLPDFKVALSAKSWSEALPFDHKPTVELVDSDEVGLVVDEPGLEWGPQDLPPLGLAKLTLNLISDNDVVATTLQSIVRAMRHK